jgi:hypothetical protein
VRVRDFPVATNISHITTTKHVSEITFVICVITSGFNVIRNGVLHYAVNKNYQLCSLKFSRLTQKGIIGCFRTEFQGSVRKVYELW